MYSRGLQPARAGLRVSGTTWIWIILMDPLSIRQNEHHRVLNRIIYFAEQRKFDYGLALHAIENSIPPRWLGGAKVMLRVALRWIFVS